MKILPMFFNELQPMLQELIQQPVAFMGGFVSGVLGLNPKDEPLKGWLEKKGGLNLNQDFPDNQDKSSGPQVYFY